MKKTYGVFLTGLLFYSLILLLGACGGNDYIPKPRGFFRIDLPEKKYQLFDSVCPYTFEYPVYARIEPDRDLKAEPYWINLEFPQFRGTLHLSYKTINNNLPQYFSDARDFVNKHIPKADDIVQTEYHNDSNDVHGIVYDIKGSNVASSYQFCVTDSSRHFLRGALYFWEVPNNDSLAPVLDFIRIDMDHMLSTLKWRNTGKAR